jgi:hypothetical protein
VKIGETPDVRLQTRRRRLEVRTNVGLTTRWKVNVSSGGVAWQASLTAEEAALDEAVPMDPAQVTRV